MLPGEERCGFHGYVREQWEGEGGGEGGGRKVREVKEECWSVSDCFRVGGKGGCEGAGQGEGREKKDKVGLDRFVFNVGWEGRRVGAAFLVGKAL